MTATPAFGFPWLSHLTIRESDTIEREIEKIGEQALLAKLRTRDRWTMGQGGNVRTAADLLGYLARNPRKPKAVA